MRTLAPPAGRGYEFLTGRGWDFAAELAELPELLAAKLAAPSVEPGHYDLVIDPSNLWLTIHESIGHATELDRALGYEAAYAGTSFATPDKLGRLRYGSEIMHVTGDRTAEHGLATIGYDDEGVAGAVLGPDQRRHPGRLPARPADGAAQGLRAVQRVRVLRRAWPHAAAADGERVTAAGAGRPLHRRPHRRGGARDLHPGRQELVDRHAAVQLPVHRPAVLQDRERAAGRAARATWPTRPPRPTSGARWRPSAARRPTCSAARSTAARASRARSRRSATAARRSLMRGVRILNTAEEGAS